MRTGSEVYKIPFGNMISSIYVSFLSTNFSDYFNYLELLSQVYFFFRVYRYNTYFCPRSDIWVVCNYRVLYSINIEYSL